MDLNKIYNIDCMDGMREIPDKYFELAIVDPPYGIDKAFSVTSRIGKYGNISIVNETKPDAAYFDELRRVSKNQIIWGYNHLSDLLPPTKEFVFWYKHQPVVSYSDGELAWTSFQRTARCFDYPFYGAIGSEYERIHPTQKPVALYKWLLIHYANKGDKILDTHVGSGSSFIAAYDMGYDIMGFEIDKDYFDAAIRRLDEHKAQLQIGIDWGVWKNDNE